MKYNKSEIMREAHRKYKHEPYKSLSEALTQTWFEAKFDDWYRTVYQSDDEYKYAKGGNHYEE